MTTIFRIPSRCQSAAQRCSRISLLIALFASSMAIGAYCFTPSSVRDEIVAEERKRRSNLDGKRIAQISQDTISKAIEIIENPGRDTLRRKYLAKCLFECAAITIKTLGSCDKRDPIYKGARNACNCMKLQLDKILDQ